MMKQAGLKNGLPHVHPDQLASNRPGAPTGRVPFHLYFHYPLTPLIVALDPKRWPAKMAGKLTDPGILKRDLLLAHTALSPHPGDTALSPRPGGVATPLGERAERLGKSTGHTHLRQLKAELAGQPIRQPGHVVHWRDDGPGTGALHNAGQKLSRAGALPQREHQVGNRQVHGEEHQWVIHHQRKIGGSAPSLHRPGRGSETADVSQDTLTIVTLEQNKKPQYFWAAATPIQRPADRLQQVLHAAATLHLLVIGMDAIVFQSQPDNLCTGNGLQHLGNQATLFLAPGLNDHHVGGGCLHLGKRIGADNGDPDNFDTWLARKEALNALGEKRLASENKYTTEVH